MSLVLDDPHQVAAAELHSSLQRHWWRWRRWRWRWWRQRRLLKCICAQQWSLQATTKIRGCGRHGHVHKRTHASVVGVESVAPMSSTSSTPPNSNPPSNASLPANASSPSNASSASNAASVAARRRIWYTTTPQSYSTETLSKHIAHCTQQKHIAHTTTPQKLCLNMAIGPPTHQCHRHISPAQVTCCMSWARSVRVHAL